MVGFHRHLHLRCRHNKQNHQNYNLLVNPKVESYKSRNPIVKQEVRDFQYKYNLNNTHF